MLFILHSFKFFFNSEIFLFVSEFNIKAFFFIFVVKGLVDTFKTFVFFKLSFWLLFDSSNSLFGINISDILSVYFCTFVFDGFIFCLLILFELDFLIGISKSVLLSLFLIFISVSDNKLELLNVLKPIWIFIL